MRNSVWKKILFPTIPNLVSHGLGFPNSHFVNFRTEIVNIDLQKKPEWYFKKHYQGKVPTFEHDGKVGILNIKFSVVIK